jgi:hypothetical protein
MEDDRYTRITLRIPKDLHAKLQGSADATSKSMNAEIIDRLDGSFENPKLLDGISDSLDKLIESAEQKNTVINIQSKLLSMCGVFLRLAVSRVAESDNPTSNRLMELTKEFADSMVHGDMEAAQKPVLEMVRLGMDIGMLDDHGQVKPEYEHLRPNLRKKVRP